MVPDSLVLCTEQMQASLKRCLGGILAATLSNDTWLRARVSVKKGGFGIRDPVLHSPAAFVSSITSTEVLCHNSGPRTGPLVNLTWRHPAHAARPRFTQSQPRLGGPVHNE